MRWSLRSLRHPTSTAACFALSLLGSSRPTQHHLHLYRRGLVASGSPLIVVAMAASSGSGSGKGKQGSSSRSRCHPNKHKAW